MSFMSDKEFRRRYNVKSRFLESNSLPLTSLALTMLEDAFTEWGDFDRTKANELAPLIIEAHSEDGID